MKFASSAALVALLAVTALPAAAANPAPARIGTAVPVILDTPLSSRTAQVGDRFAIRAAEDVRIDANFMVPAGSRGVGEVTRVVRKGAFGRSGKIEMRMVHMVIAEQHINLDGLVERRGRSGTLPTLAVASVAGLLSGFVTGRSAELAPGTRLSAYIN